MAPACPRDMLGQEIVLTRWRPTSQGVAMIGMALGQATASVAGGLLVERWGFGALFFGGALAAAAAAGLLFAYRRGRPARPRPERQLPDAT